MADKPKPLSAEEAAVIIDKGTERPFTGEYNQHFVPGIYVCRQCHAPLYLSTDKFQSHCGWPSFDDEIANAIGRQPDIDGRRVEINCQRCAGHLGHVFEGEQLTAKNTRHCVNSISLRFLSVEKCLQLAAENDASIGAAIYAAGCFWGVQYQFDRLPGVLLTQVGYTGGHVDQPSYEAVCRHDTGHAEALLVIYDKSQTDFKTLTQCFFEIHDPTQHHRQGPDIGSQYRSEIFTLTDEQADIANALIDELSAQNLSITTQVTPASTFWPAEEYHQAYYDKKGGTPYCHTRTKRGWQDK